MRPGRRAWRRSLRASTRLSRGFLVGSLRHLRLHVPGPWSVVFWTCFSRARPFPRDAPRLPLLLSILQRCFRSTAGAAILHVSLSSRPDVGGTPSISPGSRLSVCLLSLSDPPLAGTPRCGASDGSSRVCLHRESHREQQSFSYGVDSFFGNDRFTSSLLTRSSDNFLYPSRYSRLYLFCLLSARAAHLALGGLRWSPHLLPNLCTYV